MHRPERDSVLKANTGRHRPTAAPAGDAPHPSHPCGTDERSGPDAPSHRTAPLEETAVTTVDNQSARIDVYGPAHRPELAESFRGGVLGESVGLLHTEGVA